MNARIPTHVLTPVTGPAVVTKVDPVTPPIDTPQCPLMANSGHPATMCTCEVPHTRAAFLHKTGAATCCIVAADGGCLPQMCPDTHEAFMTEQLRNSC